MWLDRYHDGDRANVWHEMRQLGARDESGLRSEAQDVCDEMARRAKRNVELIIERLSDEGYRFHTDDDDKAEVVPHVPPTRDCELIAEWLQGQFRFVPMTLLSWLRIVGDVWLVGSHPRWDESSAADPLVIEIEYSRYGGESAVDYYTEELAAYREASATDGAKPHPFVLPLSPDRLHKSNVSGGQPFGVVLPDGCIDALFVGAVAMPFVDYLNWVFENGGFPGTASSAQHWSIKHSLAQDLLPL